MRLATIITPNGPRLHVKTDSGGYADIAEAAGEPRPRGAHVVPAGGPAALEAARGLPGLRRPRLRAADFGPAVPRPRGSSASA